MLDGLPVTDYSAVSPAWFEQVAGEPVGYDGAFVGPLREAAGEFSGGTPSGGVTAAGGGDQWIVRLTEAATLLAGSVRETERLLDAPGVDFQVIRGLGLPGQVLVRSALSPDQAEAQLAGNPRVATSSRMPRSSRSHSQRSGFPVADRPAQRGPVRRDAGRRHRRAGSLGR